MDHNSCVPADECVVCFPPGCNKCFREFGPDDPKWKCCPRHTSKDGPDVLCGWCVATLHPEYAVSGGTGTKMPSKKIPLTVDLGNGQKKVIGEAEINEDGTMSASITDKEVARLIGGKEGKFSITHQGDNTTVEFEQVRRNVFDKE